MNLQHKAALILQRADEAAKAPVLQQIGKVKALLPEVGSFMQLCAGEITKLNQTNEALQSELSAMKKALSRRGIVAFDAES